MEKKHIARILFYETLYISIGSLLAGVLVGVILSKLFLIILVNIIDLDVPMKLGFSEAGALAVLILFGIVFLLTYLETVWQVRLSKPIELLSGGNVGEKEPKTKWIMTTIGLICLGVGYYIAITTKSPLSAIPLFLFAVIMVMIGTYCLFTAGSIAILKILRRNKKYYYQTKHFTSVSGMIYRMKQNAAGLANICILSTGFLLMISASIALYAGIDDQLIERYPSELQVVMRETTREEALDFKQKLSTQMQGLVSKNIREEMNWSFTSLQKGSDFAALDMSQETVLGDNMALITCMLAEDYEKIGGEVVPLEPGEVQVQVIFGDLPDDTINLYGKSYQIKNRIEGDEDRISEIYTLSKMYYVIFPDEASINELLAKLPNDNQKSSFYYSMGFDTGEDVKTQVAKGKTLISWVEKVAGSYPQSDIYVECREANREDAQRLYGGMFFVGIFMGMLFLMATVLIIYYKQISEGYDDRERFKIMQKVGMSQKEVRKSIRSQVLTVFFIPLVTACVHMAFAFPIMRRLMALLNLTNVQLFILACVVTVFAFAAIYGVVYSLTARTYYRIVKGVS
jgi:putative ABC transport system permease protein